MLRIKELLFAYILRLPFFLFVYTVILMITKDDSSIFMLLAIFTVQCVLDVLVYRIRLIIVIFCSILAVAIVFSGMTVVAIAVLVFLMYRPEQYSEVRSIALISLLFVLTVITLLFIEPELGYICIRNLVIAAIAAIMARQMQTIDRFLSSYYCRGVSRKIASSITKRSFLLAITCLVGFVVIVLFVRPYGTVIPLPEFTPYVTEEAEIFEEPQEDTEPIEGELEEADDPDQPIMQDILAEENEPHFIAVVIIVAVIVFLCILALLFNKLFHRNVYQFEDYDDVIEETSFMPDGKLKKRRRLLNFGVDYTIRRLFKRKVNEYVTDKGMNARKSDTPKKLADTIGEWEDVGTLKQLYHKARYSEEHVTRAELKELFAERRKNT